MSDKTQEFIEKAIIIHGDKYDYSKVEYVNARTKVVIVCKEHGAFEQNPRNHLKGCICLKCSGKNKSTTDEFIKKAIIVHKNKYDYSKVNYINNNTKVIIICKTHGEFKQMPTNHLMGANCYYCGIENMKKKIPETHLNLLKKQIKYIIKNIITQRLNIKTL